MNTIVKNAEAILNVCSLETKSPNVAHAAVAASSDSCPHAVLSVKAVQERRSVLRHHPVAVAPLPVVPAVINECST